MTIYKKLSEMKKGEVFCYNSKVLLTFIKKHSPNIYKTKNFDNDKTVYCLDLGAKFKMFLYEKKEG